MAEKWSAKEIRHYARQTAWANINLYQNTKRHQRKTLRQFVNDETKSNKSLKEITRGQNVDYDIQSGIDEAIAEYYERRQNEPELKRHIGLAHYQVRRRINRNDHFS